MRISDWSSDVCSSDLERHERGVEVMDHLSGGAGQPVLEALREDYPFLAEGIIQYALGDVWGRGELADRTSQLAVIAAFAAQGNLRYMTVHADRPRVVTGQSVSGRVVVGGCRSM